jgi:HSP20 family protein
LAREEGVMSDEREQEKGIRLRRRGPPSWPEEFERFLDWPFRGLGLRRRMWRRWPRPWREEGWLPDIDVFEREGKFVVRTDLPGMKLDDIDVAIEGDALVVRGQRREEREVRDEDYYCCERAAGEFSRAIGLPEGADAEHIEATYQDGVLEVTVPIAEARRARKVEVKVK